MCHSSGARDAIVHDVAVLTTSNFASAGVHLLFALCVPASTQVQPGDYVSKVADALGLSAEQLLQQNVGRIPNLGAWLKPGQQLQACDVSELAHMCSLLLYAWPRNAMPCQARPC